MFSRKSLCKQTDVQLDMARITSVIVLCASASLVLGSAPTGPGFYNPGGDPQHQQQNGQSGFMSRFCVTSPADCPCPTTFFSPRNCYFCGCKGIPPTGVSPLPTSPSNTQVSSVSSGPSKSTTVISYPVTSPVTSFVTDYCLIAKHLCEKNCPDGYLVDPNDCTFCLCKKDLITG